MAAHTSADSYRRGVELAEAGKYEEGWNCLREHLHGAPQDVPALNDAGVILHHLGRAEEAIGLLTKARRLQDNPEIVCNLVEAHLGGGRAAEAARLFDDMERMGTLSIDVLNRTATMLLDEGRKGQAIEVLLRSHRLWPQQEELRPILDGIRSKRPKVAFFRHGAGEDGISAGVGELVQQRFQTEFYDGRTPGEIGRLMEWSDIAWFDGGGDGIVEASRQAGRHKIVASVRCSDVRDRWPQEVRWENVDILAQIGSSAVEDVLLGQVPEIRSRTRLAVVPNGVNLKRYPFRRRKRGKHLACIGDLTLEANPAFLLQCMQKLHSFDAGCRLFFSGPFENPVLEQYLRHMIRVLNLTGWLSDKHFLVAAGMAESHVETLLAGMACGVKPVVHGFPGADKLLGPQYLFHIAEQFCEQVLSTDYQPRHYRRFVEEHHSVEQQFKRVDEILTGLETEIERQTEAPLGRKASATRNHPGVPVAGDGVK